jgi:hypothetical protein
MNEWIKRSIKLANSPGYLDKLFEIYSVELGMDRAISDDASSKIKRAFRTRNKLLLLETLLKLPKFPIDHPYVASLRRHPYLLKKNPKTVERITKTLFSADLPTILILLTRPKSPTRQLGRSFKNWLQTIGYPFLEKNRIEKYGGTAFLKGSETQLKQFAIENLKVKNLRRRPDFILKIKNKFIIGESKFLTDYGGSQNNQFDGALEIAKVRRNNVIGIAVLDGIVWFKSKTYMHRTIRKFNGVALSALLLKNYIDRQN